jgi:hypothetical protein
MRCQGHACSRQKYNLVGRPSAVWQTRVQPQDIQVCVRRQTLRGRAACLDGPPVSCTGRRSFRFAIFRPIDRTATRHDTLRASAAYLERWIHATWARATEATEHARRTVVLTLVSDVAQRYVALRELDLDLAIARRTLASPSGSVPRRRSGGSRTSSPGASASASWWRGPSCCGRA